MKVAANTLATKVQAVKVVTNTLATKAEVTKVKAEAVKINAEAVKVNAEAVKVAANTLATETALGLIKAEQIKIAANTLLLKTGALMKSSASLQVDASTLGLDTTDLETAMAKVKTAVDAVKTAVATGNTEAVKVAANTLATKVQAVKVVTNTLATKAEVTKVKAEAVKINAEAVKVNAEAVKVAANTLKNATDTYILRLLLQKVRDNTLATKTEAAGINTKSADMKTSTADSKTNLDTLIAETLKVLSEERVVSGASTWMEHYLRGIKTNTDTSNTNFLRLYKSVGESWFKVMRTELQNLQIVLRKMSGFSGSTTPPVTTTPITTPPITTPPVTTPSGATDAQKASIKASLGYRQEERTVFGATVPAGTYQRAWSRSLILSLLRSWQGYGETKASFQAMINYWKSLAKAGHVPGGLPLSTVEQIYKNYPNFHTGGRVKRSGPHNLLRGEEVLNPMEAYRYRSEMRHSGDMDINITVNVNGDSAVATDTVSQNLEDMLVSSLSENGRVRNTLKKTLKRDFIAKH